MIYLWLNFHWTYNGCLYKLFFFTSEHLSHREFTGLKTTIEIAIAMVLYHISNWANYNYISLHYSNECQSVSPCEHLWLVCSNTVNACALLQKSVLVFMMFLKHLWCLYLWCCVHWVGAGGPCRVIFLSQSVTDYCMYTRNPGILNTPD